MLNHLQRPEQSILNLLNGELRSMRMLDIGFGAGRTTHHFADLVAEYVAVDYSQNMIQACEQRFGNASNHVSFKVCDVRSMTMFADGAFDFILFSYNGIDSISHADRLIAFREIKRVCKPGGRFCFSSHNLQSIDQLFAVQSSDLARIIYRKWFRNPLLMLLNESFQELKTRPYAIIRDGTHWFRLKTYYIKPVEQVRQLENIGFKDTRLYQLNGDEIRGSACLQNTVADHWIYYLCSAS
jgi:ubiquinone/menaquinone biosynthesis C-methylase UbiE